MVSIEVTREGKEQDCEHSFAKGLCQVSGSCFNELGGLLARGLWMTGVVGCVDASRLLGLMHGNMPYKSMT